MKTFNKPARDSDLKNYISKQLTKKGWEKSCENPLLDKYNKNKEFMYGFPYSSSSKIRVKELLKGKHYNTDFVKFTYNTYKNILANSSIFKYNLLFLKKSQGSQGKHVFPVKCFEDVAKIMETKYKNNDQIFILEKGIDNPLLYNNKKFDMRIYLLFTRENNSYKSYLYQEWFIRTSSSIYKPNNTSLKNMLTNTSFQGNKSANTFVYSKIKNFNTNDKDKMTRNIYYCLDSFCSIWKAYLKSANNKYFGENKTTGFQYNLFGIDIIMDSELKPYVIEINATPLFGIRSSAAKVAALKKNMWKDICSNFIDSFAETNTINPKSRFIEIGEVKSSIEVAFNIVDKKDDDLISEKDINHKENISKIIPQKANWKHVFINPF